MTEQNNNRESICIDGCSINNKYVRDLGYVFTWNLENQINNLAEKMR